MAPLVWCLIAFAVLVALVFQKLDLLKGFIMASAAENQAKIDSVSAQVEKAKSEIVAAIADLKAQAEAGQDLDFTALEGGVQALDDLNPDAVEETPAE